MRPLAIVGNVNVDIIVGDCSPVLKPGTESMVAHGDVRPAGCVGNTALAWMAMKVPFQAAANTGNDMLGDWLRSVFAAHSARWPRESCATTFSVGIAHPDSERTFLTTPGHLTRFSFAQVEAALDLKALRGGIALVVGSFLTERLAAEYGRLFDLLAAHDVQIALDTGWPVTGWTSDVRKQCLAWAARCDHLLLNEVELMSMFGETRLDAAMKAAARSLPQGGSVIAKRGPNGASGLKNGDLVHAPAPSVPVLDTAGAGDIFNAGYLARMAQGASLPEALEAGVAAASRAISTNPREYHQA
jgi:sugar/nucleoside kinase (ribokinase family)